jgi:hypothetical protein
MLSRPQRTPFRFGLILSVVAVTTATRAETPFFWDDFDRESLEGGNVDWRVSDGEAYLQDGSLFMMLTDANLATAAAVSPLVGDFTVRTQISFAGAETAGGDPWIGVLGPLSANSRNGGTGSKLNWGGAQPSGVISVGTNLSGVNQTYDWSKTLATAEIFQRDIQLQYDAVGGQIGLSAWFVGEDKPAEPQVTMEQVVRDGDEFGINLSRNNSLGAVATVRYFAVLPAITGDFSDSGVLDVEDINLIDEKLRGASENRVFDLNEDTVVTGEDLRVLIQDLMGASFGDANLDGAVDAADLNRVALNWQSPTTTSWALGDFTSDGHTDAADLNLIALNWQSGSQAAISAASVPEPASVFLLVVGLMMGLARRRCRHA